MGKKERNLIINIVWKPFFGNYDDYIDYADRIASYTYWNNIGISGLACMLLGLDEVHKKQREI